MMMMLMSLFWLVALVGLAKWVFGQPADRALPERTQRTEAEVARLREEVDRLAGLLDRVTEEQSFLVKLLTEGERGALPGAGPPRLDAPHTDAQPSASPSPRTGASPPAAASEDRPGAAG